MKSALLLCGVLAGVSVNGDIYLHNPRGSNNRLDEANRDRNNGNRLFDSQNNNRGGNNVGQVYYYEGSTVSIEWTAQHTCGNPNNNCELILQYMCDDRLRDGTTTRTIPTKPIECYNWDCDTDVRYGRHESWDYYMNCDARARNLGLFTADQDLGPEGRKDAKGNFIQDQNAVAVKTRQNPNGARRGFECPEERDYYPYWGPSPWRDIAVLTNQPQRCKAYQEESQNVKSRWFCDLPYTARKLAGRPIPITQMECESFVYDDKALNKTNIRGKWREQKAWGTAPPVCQDNVWSRDNHLGNVEGGNTANWNWTVPGDVISEQCVLRIRYNISTGDMPHFDNVETITGATLTSKLNGNGRSGNNKRKGPAVVDIASKYGIPARDAALREYQIQNNPVVDAFGSQLKPSGTRPADTPTTKPAAGAATDKPSDRPTLYPPASGAKPIEGLGPVRLQLAINTAQYGRTFQDRTHKFAIRKRDPALAKAVIHNLQVRGKRGNIVQTFPGTEYDFVPNSLHCRNGDYIHFQWTGSNTNPNNNAGQGQQGTDRHNIVMLRNKVYNEAGQSENPVKSFGQWGSSYPARIDDPQSPFLGLSKTDLQHLAVLDTPGGQFGGEMSELDDAGTYFDLGVKQCTNNGVYHYMCTRNNNFSNRSQKGKIVVSEEAVSSMQLGWAGGTLVLDGNRVQAMKGALTGPQVLSMTSYPRDYPSSLKDQHGSAASKFMGVTAENSEGNQFALAQGQTIQIVLEYDTDPVGYASLYRSDSLTGSWEEISSAKFESGTATADANKGGYFVVVTKPNVAAIVLTTFAVLGVLGGGGYLLYKKKFAGSDLQKMRNGV